MKKNYLLTPGPTPIPPEVLSVMGEPIIHHRTPQFKKIFGQINKDLKYVFKTENDVLTFASSGTGAMQATVINLLSPGDKAVVVKAGKFGKRWEEICDAFGIEVLPIDVQWGKAVDPSEIAAILDKEKDKIKAVFTTFCETSTGVVTDIETIGKIVDKYSAVLVVDAISALGGLDLETDEWHIDVVIAGSQKALMIPPGLSFLSVSDKAWRLVESSKLPKYYFDFKAYKKSIDKTDTPFTPAVTLLIALAKALEIIRNTGIDNVFKNHKLLASATRASVKALGLELFAEYPADVITAAKVPQGIDGQEIVKIMREEQGVSIAGGQAELKGKIIRIAHMGYIGRDDIIKGISTLETVLNKLGHKFEPGIGVKTFKEVLGGK